MGWLNAKNVDHIICNVTKALVGDYIAKVNGIGRRHRGPKAINNQVSALSSYWRYLKIPIHSAAKPIMDKRLADKRDTEFLIEELKFL